MRAARCFISATSASVKVARASSCLGRSTGVAKLSIQTPCRSGCPSQVRDAFHVLAAPDCDSPACWHTAETAKPPSTTTEARTPRLISAADIIYLAEATAVTYTPRAEKLSHPQQEGAFLLVFLGQNRITVIEIVARRVPSACAECCAPGRQCTGRRGWSRLRNSALPGDQRRSERFACTSA